MRAPLRQRLPAVNRRVYTVNTEPVNKQAAAEEAVLCCFSFKCQNLHFRYELRIVSYFIDALILIQCFG